MEDAYPLPFRDREVQASFRYDRRRESKDLFALSPRIEVGALPNLQAAIAVPFLFGSATTARGGNVDLDVLYNFNTEGAPRPRDRGPGGIPHRGRLFRRRSPREARGHPQPARQVPLPSPPSQLLLDAEHRPAGGRAVGALRGVLGHQVRAGPDTMLIADAVRTLERREGEASNVLEVGVRRQVTPLLALLAGVAAGIFDQSPPFRVLAGAQYTLPF